MLTMIRHVGSKRKEVYAKCKIYALYRCECGGEIECVIDTVVRQNQQWCRSCSAKKAHEKRRLTDDYKKTYKRGVAWS